MKRPDSFLRRERVRTATAARHQRDDRDNTPNRYRDSSPPTAACRLLHVGQSTEPGRDDQRAPRAAVPFPGMGSDLRLRDYVGADRDRIVANLLEWLQIPSISAHPERASDVRASGAFCAGLLDAAGLEHVELLETDGGPAAYGDWLHAGPGAPTVLVLSLIHI